tara:strand:+ start:1045 stop:1620 length:576 start_codon:yes stop_codon:yes gene_type:complete
MPSSKEYILQTIQQKINELKEQTEKVVILENKLHNLNYAFSQTSYKIKVEDSYLDFIEKLTFMIDENNFDISIQDLEEYNYFMLQVFGYYHIFNNYIENRMTKKVHELLENPRLLFDPIFYKNEILTEEKRILCYEVLRDLKYIYNCIINTRDEFDFDLNYIDNNNKEVNYMLISFLDNLYTTFNNELITI